jgi:hypothetical protein
VNKMLQESIGQCPHGLLYGPGKEGLRESGGLIAKPDRSVRKLV